MDRITLQFSSAVREGQMYLCGDQAFIGLPNTKRRWWETAGMKERRHNRRVELFKKQILGIYR